MFFLFHRFIECMKIAHVVCAFPPYKGGMGNAAYHFARVSAEMDYDVTVFTPDYSVIPVLAVFRPEKKEFFCGYENITKRVAGENEAGKKFKVVKLRPWFKYGNAAFLPQLLWRLRGFDIVHLHYPFYGAASLVLARIILAGGKPKLVIHYHMDTAAAGLKGLIFKLGRIFVLPLLARMAKAISCASLDYIKHSDLGKFYNIHKGKFRQTLFGVDTDRFRPDAESHSPEEGERTKKNILFVAGLDEAHYFKGLEVLLWSLQKTAEEINCVLTVVGEGELRGYYEKIAAALKIKDKVIFAGAVTDEKLPDYYRDCDVFVLPSINQGEAFGLVLLEAMASGKPVIASNLPGVRSIFKNKEEGLLAEPNNADDLAAKLKYILKNEELAAKIGRAARELVEKKYTWDKVAKQLDLIYHYAKYTPR